MRKRLRKKLHVGEFQVLGFEVTGALVEGTGQAEERALLDDLIDFVEAHGLFIGGGVGGRSGIGLYVDRGRASATEADRGLLGGWLRARPEVARVEAHALSDAYYPDGPRRRR